MTNEFHDWAMKAWEVEVLRNLPAVKVIRQLKAGRVESRRALARARRSLAAQQASTQRKLHQRQAEIERESRERERIRDAEMERKRWDFITRSL